MHDHDQTAPLSTASLSAVAATSKGAAAQQAGPYVLSAVEKEAVLFPQLQERLAFHYAHCPEYARILNTFGVKLEKLTSIAELPFLPVALFKRLKLCSVPDSEIFKVLRSSGTSGQMPSRVFLDRTNALQQQKTLVQIVTSFLQQPRLPMLIIDTPTVIQDRKSFSARGAGILGFSLFGADRTYALKEDMSLDHEAIDGFLQRHAGQQILLFGFTFVLWQYLCEALRREEQSIDLSGAVVFHGGGWKRLVGTGVNRERLYTALAETCHIDPQNIHDYYGMSEQTGTIAVECEFGHLHCCDLSEIIVRNPLTLKECAVGESGVIQTISLLPSSYPGNSILTDDVGVVLGCDDCPCGRKGKYFRVEGRLPQAELRGCSDTYQVPH